MGSVQNMGMEQWQSAQQIKKTEKIVKAIGNPYYTRGDYYHDVERFILALEHNRLIATIPHVSRSGLSRAIKLVEFNKDLILSFRLLAQATGFKPYEHSDAVVVHGYGMDLVTFLVQCILNTAAGLAVIPDEVATTLLGTLRVNVI